MTKLDLTQRATPRGMVRSVSIAALAIGLGATLTACSPTFGSDLVKGAGELTGIQELSALSDGISQIEGAVSALGGAVTVISSDGTPSTIAVAEGDQYLIFGSRDLDPKTASCTVDPDFGTVTAVSQSVMNIPTPQGTRFSLGEFTATASGDASISCEAPSGAGIVAISASAIQQVFEQATTPDAAG